MWVFAGIQINAQESSTEEVALPHIKHKFMSPGCWGQRRAGRERLGEYFGVPSWRQKSCPEACHQPMPTTSSSCFLGGEGANISRTQLNSALQSSVSTSPPVPYNLQAWCSSPVPGCGQRAEQTALTCHLQSSRVSVCKKSHHSHKNLPRTCLQKPPFGGSSLQPH